MSARDRMVLIVVVVLVALGGAWMLVVSPKRQEASKLSAQVTEAKTLLATAEGELAHAHAAQSQYATAYTSIVSLGKAVPASEEVPSLIYELTQASNQKKVDFSSIVASGSSAGSGPASGPAAAAAAAAAAAGFSQMPFTFVFNGTFFDLEHLFQQLNRFTVRGASGGLQVSGRLLTMQSVKLTPALASAQQATGSSRSQLLTGTITASAYVLPAAQGLTAGATPTSPTGASTPATSTTGASSSPTAPAIARVTP
jgi:Type II secretion system (T2SS), protein M